MRPIIDVAALAAAQASPRAPAGQPVWCHPVEVAGDNDVECRSGTRPKPGNEAEAEGVRQ